MQARHAKWWALGYSTLTVQASFFGPAWAAGVLGVAAGAWLVVALYEWGLPGPGGPDAS